MFQAVGRQVGAPTHLQQQEQPQIHLISTLNLMNPHYQRERTTCYIGVLKWKWGCCSMKVLRAADASPSSCSSVEQIRMHNRAGRALPWRCWYSGSPPSTSFQR